MTKGELIKNCILHLGEDDEFIDPTVVSSYIEYEDSTRKMIPIINRCLEIVGERLKLPIKCVEYSIPNKTTYDGTIQETSIYTKYIKDGVVECIVYYNKVKFKKPNDFKQFAKCVLMTPKGLNRIQNGGVLGDYIEFDLFGDNIMCMYYYPKFVEYLEPNKNANAPFEDIFENTTISDIKKDPSNDNFVFVETPRSILNLVPMYVYSELKKEEQPSLAINESNKFFAFLDEINYGDNEYHQTKVSFDFQEEFD